MLCAEPNSDYILQTIELFYFRDSHPKRSLFSDFLKQTQRNSNSRAPLI
jgi:hypothetical protein